MFDDNKCKHLSELLEEATNLNSRKQKHYKIEMLKRYKERLCRFNEINERQIKKLILLLEYTLTSAINEEDVSFQHNLRTLRNHSIKHFGICPEDDLRCKCIVEGVFVGTVLGGVLSILIGNPVIGFLIGISLGFIAGFYISNIDVEVAKQEDRLL